MCTTEPQIHLSISLLLIVGFFQGNFCFQCSSFILTINFSGLSENQVAGNKLAILSREGFSYRELDGYELVESFKRAVSLLGLQRDSQSKRKAAPARILVPLSHRGGGPLQEAVLGQLSQEHPVSWARRT